MFISDGNNAPKRKAPQMKIQAGQILENALPNTARVLAVVRVIGYVESVQMWRVTHTYETRPDAWLIENDRTWAVPAENLRPHDEAGCEVCHKSGLVALGGR